MWLNNIAEHEGELSISLGSSLSALVVHYLITQNNESEVRSTVCTIMNELCEKTVSSYYVSAELMYLGFKQSVVNVSVSAVVGLGFTSAIWRLGL